jgi:hypothetical protein
MGGYGSPSGAIDLRSHPDEAPIETVPDASNAGSNLD